MATAFRYLLYILVLCVAVIAGYALIFDLPAPQTDVEKPVALPQ